MEGNEIFRGIAWRLQSGDWKGPFSLQHWYPLCPLARHPATFHFSLPGGKKGIYVALDTSATRLLLFYFLQCLYEPHSLWKRFLATLGTTQSPVLNPNPSREEIAPPIKPGPSSMHCMGAEQWPRMEEKVQEKVANARLQSGQLARDCKLLQDYPETRMQSTHYSPDTAKKKKKISKRQPNKAKHLQHEFLGFGMSIRSCCL